MTGRIAGRRLSVPVLVGAGLLVALAMVLLLAPRASSSPDGLNRVAIDKGFSDTQKDHALKDSPTAGYAVKGVGDKGLSKGLAGAIGVGVTFVFAGGLFWVARRRRTPTATD